MTTTLKPAKTSKTKTELIFDLETTGLLRKGSQIHCIVNRHLGECDVPVSYVQDQYLAKEAQDKNEAAYLRFYAMYKEKGYPHVAAQAKALVSMEKEKEPWEVSSQIFAGVHEIMSADLIIGHNILSYDLPLLKEQFPQFSPRGKKIDTLVLSRLFYPHILERDYDKSPEGMPVRLYGRHSLEAWGWRLRCHKGDFGKQPDAWSRYTPEMLDYCSQDTYVTYLLYVHLTNRMKHYA